MQTSSMGGGDLTIFFHRPIAMVLFAIAVVILFGQHFVRLVTHVSATRQESASK